MQGSWFGERLKEEQIVEKFKQEFNAVELDNNEREVTRMVSDAQIAFFSKLLEEKDFGKDNDKKDSLREQFASLNTASASKWIETAIKLPKRDESDDPIIAPPFGV